MNKLKLFAIFIPFMLSAEVMANCAGTYCANVKVENLYTTTTGNILLMTSGDESKLTCSGTDGSYVTLNTDDRNSDKVFSILLAAKTADKAVGVRITANSGGCEIQRVEYGKYF